MSVAGVPAVVNDANAHRFEIRTEVGVAYLRYDEDANTIALVHTRVPPELEGRGFASALAHAALEHARATHRRAIPTCPFVQSYLRRHPEYGDLVDAA